MQVTTRQLPHHRVVRSNTHVNHRDSTSPIVVNLDILSTAFALSFSNKSTTILLKTYTNMWIYLQLSMVVSTVVWDVCQTVVCAHVASVCRTAEAVRDISRAIFSTTPTCARYNLYLVVVILTYLAQLTKQPVHTGSYQLLSFGFRRVLANEEDLASRAPSTTSSTKSSYLQVQKTHPSITFYIETQK